MTKEQKISYFEEQIISRVLNGNHPIFELLNGQVDYLSVEDRSFSPKAVTLKLALNLNESSTMLKGSEANMEILDTRVFLPEVDSVLFIKLKIVSGKIFSLTMGGVENPHNIETLKLGKTFWSNTFKKEPEEDINYDPSNRNYDKAFGYLPEYR